MIEEIEEIKEVLWKHLKSHIVVAREQLTDKDKLTIFREFDEAIQKQLDKLDKKEYIGSLNDTQCFEATNLGVLKKERAKDGEKEPEVHSGSKRITGAPEPPVPFLDSKPSEPFKYKKHLIVEDNGYYYCKCCKKSYQEIVKEPTEDWNVIIVKRRCPHKYHEMHDSKWSEVCELTRKGCNIENCPKKYLGEKEF